MPIAISSRFDFTCDQPTDLILQFEAAAIPEQTILSTDTRINSADIARVPAHDSVGERVLATWNPAIASLLKPSQPATVTSPATTA